MLTLKNSVEANHCIKSKHPGAIINRAGKVKTEEPAETTTIQALLCSEALCLFIPNSGLAAFVEWAISRVRASVR